MVGYRADVLWLLIVILDVFFIKKVIYVSPEVVTTTFTSRRFELLEDSSNLVMNLWIHRKCCSFTNQKYFKRGLLLLLLLLAGDVEVQPGPTYSDLGELLSHKGFSVLHQNIRGLDGKKDLLADMLFQHKNVNILSLSETFLSTHHNDCEIGGYIFEQKNRKNAKGGGVAAYIKNGVPYTRRDDLENEDLEILWLEIQIKDTKSFLLAVTYRPPDTSKHVSKSFVKLLEQKMRTVRKENKELIIIGDLNCDYSSPSTHDEIKATFHNNGFIQLVKDVTRITNNSSTLIDVILTNCPEYIVHTKVLMCSLSDHEMVGIVRKKIHHKYKPKTIRSRNFKNYNPVQISSELKNINWEPFYNCEEPNSAWKLLRQIISETCDRYIPFTSKIIKGKPCPWLTEKLKSEMNFRDKLLRKARKTEQSTDWKSYKCQKNKVTNLIKKAKSEYHQNLLNENTNKPEQFWKCIKKLFPVKPNTNSTCDKFVINGEMSSDKKLIVDGFCNFFQTVASKLKTNSIKLKDFVWHRPSARTPSVFTFRFKYVSVVEVRKQLKSLNRKKAEGSDGIPSCILKDCAQELAPPLAHLINLSLKTGTVPNELKVAKIIPIHKNGKKSEYTNYRPISILPVISKILEKCVYAQFINHLEMHNFLSPKQFGFRKQRNTEFANVLFTDAIRSAMDRGELTGALFVDLSKAFDTVSHAALLDKLPAFGVTSNELNWFTDYLFNRSMFVSHNDSISQKMAVTCGVPQGSILGPLLFLLHFNEVPDLLSHCHVLMYADDTVLYFHHKNLGEIERTITNDLKILSRWLRDNELLLNTKVGKTEVMLFGTKARLSKEKNPINIPYEGRNVNVTTSYKYLGVQLDPSLTMDDHFKSVCKKVSTRLRLLRKMRPLLTKTAAVRIYQAYVIPLITYCSLINYNTGRSRSEATTTLEQRAHEIVGTYNMASIEAASKKKICATVKKCLNGDFPFFMDYFHFIKHNHSTRNNNKLLRLPKVNLESTKRSFFYNATKVFNSLPNDIRGLEGYNEFLKALGKFLLS